MSTATLTPPAGGSGDNNLATFLAAVPAAADYDLTELLGAAPQRRHRPARAAVKRTAINNSARER